MNRVNFFYALILGVAFISCHAKTELKIYPVPGTDSIDSTKTGDKTSFSKLRYFIIAGDISRREEFLKIVDSFVKRNYDDSLHVFHDYHMSFYQQSDETNLDSLLKDPNKLDDTYAHIHDLRLSYYFIGHQSPLLVEYEDGSPINHGSHLIIKDP